jgi:hypothetical protein
MTYEPKPIDTSGVVLPGDLTDLMERLAENSHDIWAKQRIAEGWRQGPERKDDVKTHPDLVPYGELSESEKDYDRITVAATLKAIVVLGYEIGKPAEPPADQR